MTVRFCVGDLGTAADPPEPAMRDARPCLDDLLTMSCALLLQLERERLWIARELDAQLAGGLADGDPDEPARIVARLGALGADVDALRSSIEAIRRRIAAERRRMRVGAMSR